MREKDIAEKMYLSSPERFADLHNGIYGAGEQLINPQHLQPLDSDVSILDENKTGIERRKDICMLYHGKCYGIFSIENQSSIDYSMVIRNLQYDGAIYGRQLKKNGFKNLLPCINTVVYYGQSQWTAPTRLKEILKTKGMPQKLVDTVNDYTITVVDVRRLPDLSVFKTDLRHVFGFIQNDGNKDALKAYVHEYEKVFRNLQEDAFDMLCVISNIEELLKLKSKLRTAKGGYNMCQGMQEWLEEKYTAGVDQGETRLSQLMQILAADNEIDKILRASKDKDYRTQLYKKYNLM